MGKRSVAAALVALIAGTASAGNYVLRIDGKEYELDLGERTTATLPDGRAIEVELRRTPVAGYKTSGFSFSHSSQFTPSRTKVDDGIYQTMMTTPSGTMVLVQEYAGTDPSTLVDFMLTQLLKEEVQYGYQITKAAASKALADGKTMAGKRAVSKFRNDEYERHVLAYGTRDAGILIVTQVEKSAPDPDLAMLDLFWKSLRIMIQ
jgi:hypothetical protein